jgi:ligand-binding sensor domain-containing protein
LSSTYIITLRAARDGTLRAARDGSLWIGTDDGLAHWVNQRLITYLKGDFVTDILEDDQGEIWAAHSKAGDPSYPLCRVVDTTVRCYGSDDGVPPFDAQPLAQDRSGNLWVGGDTKPLTSHQHRSAREDADKSLEVIGNLTAVDGATLVTFDLVVLAFGAKIRAKNVDHKPERLVISEPFEGSVEREIGLSELGWHTASVGGAVCL